MPHVFDYSTSGSGLYDPNVNQLSALFMMNSGTAVAAEYWRGLGFLTTPISYLAPTGEYDSSGNQIYRTESYTFGVDAYGGYTFDATDPAMAQFYANNPNLVVPPGFFDGVSQFTVMGFGSLMRFEGLPTIARSFGTGPTGVFADSGAASEGALALMAHARTQYFAALRAVEARSLADAGRIIMESWSDADLPGRLRLVYTPDAQTRLTVGDITRVGTSVGDEDNPYSSEILGTARRFAGEDVTVILTRFDDNFGDYYSGFSARTLRIDAGAGADNINIGGGTVDGPASAWFAQTVILNGEDGDDYLSLTAGGNATVTGGAGADLVFVNTNDGSSGTIRIEGGSGDDDMRVSGETRAQIFGGAGNDTGISYQGADSLYGGDGNDNLLDDFIYEFGSGTVTLFSAANLLDGGAGDDTLTGGGGNDTLFGGAGSDRLTGYSGNDQMTGGAGLDHYYLYSPDRYGASATRTNGNDTLRDDGGIVFVRPSDFPGSIAYQRVGNDLIFGTIGTSAHRIVDFYLNPNGWFNGRVSADGTVTPSRSGTIDWDFAATLPGPGQRITGTSGPDRLAGQAGNDTLSGEDGADTLNGLGGDDMLFGGSGVADVRDVIFGGDGNDSLDGGYGNDDLNGGFGRDTVVGGFGSDTLTGNADADTLAGGGGSDLLSGNDGADFLNGGFGFDRLNGGAGADSFFHQGVADHGTDWVQDYAAADADVLLVGLAGAQRSQFQVNFATTPGAGDAAVAEAFVIYRPTGQVLWRLVDGAADSAIRLQIADQVFDLLA